MNDFIKLIFLKTHHLLDSEANIFVTYVKEIMDELYYQYRVHARGTDLFNWKWFTTMFAFAVIIYIIRLKSIRRVFKRMYVFCKQKRVQQEFLKDMKFLVVKTLYKPFVIVFFGFNVHAMRDQIDHALNAANLKIPTLFYLDSVWGPMFKIVVAMLAYDFAYYLIHLATHKYETLWVFHKTHHRATSLNPYTRLRIHPIEYFHNFAFMAIVGTPIVYFFSSIYDIPNDKPLYLYAMAALTINHGLTHLRHSHVKIHFGLLSYVFMSPIMHQVHHSMLPRHRNKNISSLFSFWDLMFGTFYLPTKDEVFKFGIKEDRNSIPSIMEEIVYLPYKDMVKLYNKKPKPHKQNDLGLATKNAVKPIAVK